MKRIIVPNGHRRIGFAASDETDGTPLIGLRLDFAEDKACVVCDNLVIERADHRSIALVER